MLSFQISATEKLRALSKRFAETYAQIKQFDQSELEAIHRYARISMIGASTRIENAVLTDAEINWIDTILTVDGRPTAFDANRHIIENKLSKDRERSIEEVAGCREMLFLVYEQGKELFPLTEASLRGMHALLLRHFAQRGPHVGRYKSVTNSVVEQNSATGKSRVVFQTAAPGPITESAMTDLVAWYNRAILEEPWSVAVASEFVFRFLAIHPFQDGNGRVGRALFLLALLQSPDETISHLAPFLAIDRQIERHRPEYYVVLNRCSDGRFSLDPKKYQIDYFLLFMQKVLEEALDGIQIYRKRFQATRDLPESATKVLAAFREHPEIRITTQALIKETNLPRRTIGYALSLLLKFDLIQKYGKGAGVRYQLVF